MRLVDPGESQEKGRSAWLHHGYRYHITRSTPGLPLASSWWRDEDAARTRFTTVVDQLDDQPGAHATLVDEAERTTLATWPEGHA